MHIKPFLFFFPVLFLAACAASTRTGTVTPAPIPAGLSIEEHALQQPPMAEYTELSFVGDTQENILGRHADERSRVISLIDQTCTVGEHMGMCASLGVDQLVAWEDYTTGPLSTGSVTVTRAGNRIYSIPVGDSSPISPLRGLWVYANHWALETAYVTNHQNGNEIDSQATGQVSLDGVLLNDRYSYAEAFGFQTMHGQPFYFFKRDGRIDASYTGVEVPLGYDEVLHYGCCSGATLNPKVAENMVAFFARKGSTWLYVEIGVFGKK